MPLPPRMLEDEPIYVNAKQYPRILKMREKRKQRNLKRQSVTIRKVSLKTPSPNNLLTDIPARIKTQTRETTRTNKRRQIHKRKKERIKSI